MTRIEANFEKHGLTSSRDTPDRYPANLRRKAMLRALLCSHSDCDKWNKFLYGCCGSSQILHTPSEDGSSVVPLFRFHVWLWFPGVP